MNTPIRTVADLRAALDEMPDYYPVVIAVGDGSTRDVTEVRERSHWSNDRTVEIR